MLILAIPIVTLLFGEPDVKERLVVNVNVNIKTIGEHMVSIVLMAPPLRTNPQDDLSEKDVENTTNLSSAMTVVVA